MFITYIWEVPSLYQSQYNVVVLVTRVQAGWFRVKAARDFFSLLKNIQTRPGTHPASYLRVIVVLSQAVQWLGCDVDHLYPSRGDITCPTLYSFMV
jgi:hypothetical protein